MTRLPREPLTAEEHELADRLARLDAPAAPSAALDARILAAARDAVGRQGPRRARRLTRWPVALGVAATLALAVGIAWQMRPMLDSAQVYSEAPAAASSARGAGGPSVDELPGAAVAQNAATSEASHPAPLSSAGSETTPDEPHAPDAAAPARQKTREAEDADRERDTASRVKRQDSTQESANIRFVPPPAPPPQQRPAEPQEESVPADTAASDVVFDVAAPIPAPMPTAPAAAPAAEDAASGRAQGEARRTKALSKPEAGAPERIETTAGRLERDNAGFSDQALDDQPPATADSPEVQRAWLQRIRELLGKGDTAGARASLAEFKRRYPRYALPDDLRPLAPTAP